METNYICQFSLEVVLVFFSKFPAPLKQHCIFLICDLLWAIKHSSTLETACVGSALCVEI